ncbi:MAG: DUF1588 domain-containing protein [Opitutales bacterium]|nr:DUF1588 domain-containing protein [Opitutales bacterium]
MAQCFSLSADSVGQETKVSKEILGPFLQEYCIQCHGPNKQKAKLRFDTIDFAISNGNEALHYQDILDVLNSAEMPPEEKAQPSSDELERVIGELTDTLFKARKQLASSGGKVEMRRLNRREYATTIDHLFGFVPATSKIPPDGDIENFDTVGSRQYFTTEHLDQYYELAREILEVGFKWAGKREALEVNRQDPETRTNAQIRGALELWKGQTGKVVRLSKMREEYLTLPKVETGVYLSEPIRHLSYRFGVDPRGTYQLGVVAGIEGEVQPFRRFIKVAGNEGLAGVFHVDGTTDNPTESVAEIRPIALKGDRVGGHVLEDRTGAWFSHYLNSLGRYEGVDPKEEGMIWIDSFKVEGPFYPEQRNFFDALLCPDPPSPDKRSEMMWNDVNADELITRFTKEAFRHRELDAEFIEGLVSYFKNLREKGSTFEQAMIDTLAVVLASPSFVFLNEEAINETHLPKLSSRDIAIRLSYFLTSGPPDEVLYEAVEAGAISDANAYREEVDRILSKNSRVLAEGFSSQWADFIRFNSISVSKRFPTYGEGMRHSMKQEVIAYFQTMIEENLPVSNLIKSDFATVNAQMAVHYGISGVKSNAFVKVDLPPDSPRGGYLTQAAFLVAGSNGERTSPAVRGMILMNRFLNSPPAPPPPNVPELGEGADGPLTNRKLVALHTSQAQCASCHRKMDTIGLALENFDVIGRYRETERVWRSDVPITIDGSLPGGKPFKSFSQFQETLLFHEEDLARNMIESLAVYALGRDIEFTDEPHIQNMISKLRPNGFRMKDMIHAVAESPIFFNN